MQQHEGKDIYVYRWEILIPHETNKEHYHDEVLGILAPGLVFVQATRYKHL